MSKQEVVGERTSITESFSHEPLDEQSNAPSIKSRLRALVKPMPKRYILAVTAFLGFCKLLILICQIYSFMID